MRRLFALLFLCLLLPGCHRVVTDVAPLSQPPALLLGEFQDDYGNRFTITATDWLHRPRSRYHIVKWDVANQYAIAQNDSSNPGQPNRWTRIDWMEFSGMAPYAWGFCLTAYDAPSRAAAEVTPSARRATPRTGCNGFPFSRMRRLTSVTPG